MDANTIDNIARRLADHRLSRRRAIRQLGAGGFAAGLLGTAAARRQARAQATPTVGQTGELAANNATLFVQTAAGGTFEPNPAATAATPAAAGAATPTSAMQQRGDYLLTLQGHNGETIGFSDRPQRTFGEVKTPQFLKSLGFTPANPPNAALAADLAGQPDEVILLELMSPAYDSGTQTLTYEANLLHQYPNARGSALAPLASTAQTTTPAATFGSASLFIDDCLDLNNCVLPPFQGTPQEVVGPYPGGPVGQCWQWGCLCCRPCNVGNVDAINACHNAYPDRCNAYGSAIQTMCYPA